MNKAINVLNEIFQIQLKEDDLEKRVEKVLDWDSFSIMEFMSEISERYEVTIDVIQISSVVTILDLLNLINECMR